MRPILTLGVILTICSVAGAQTANLVQAELVAETKAVQAGHPFRVGLHLTIADGWHVYWINPGDAGAATTFKLTIPDGFTVGPVQYPVPENLPQPGGLTVYAYEHELLLTATVTPPTDLNGASSIPISAAAGWCVCTPEKCVLGKAKLSLDLAVVPGGASRTTRTYSPPGSRDSRSVQIRQSAQPTGRWLDPPGRGLL